MVFQLMSNRVPIESVYVLRDTGQYRYIVLPCLVRPAGETDLTFIGLHSQKHANSSCGLLRSSWSLTNRNQHHSDFKGSRHGGHQVVSRYRQCHPHHNIKLNTPLNKGIKRQNAMVPPPGNKFNLSCSVRNN